jgi:small GTP-binding protein
MDLEQYDRLKLEIGDVIRSATMRPLPGQEQGTVRDLFARLAEDRFNLVVVGRFSRGKTTLMNAMLGTDKLPTGVVPVTSVITTVTYGTDELVVLYYQNTNLFLEIPIAQLRDYITEHGNPGNVRRIRTAEVQLPAELLRRGFHFIDTPGLGSSIIENTRTTEAFLPEADALILVTSYDSPLTEEEQRTLETIHRSGRRVFLAVNKQDSVGPADRQQVMEHLQAQLPLIFGDAVPPLFSLSAQRALEARLRGNAAQLAASGLPALESRLLDFLVNERRREFLLNMCARIDAVLSAQTDSGRDRERLHALRARVETTATAGSAMPLTAPTSDIASRLPNCEVCAAIMEATFNFVAHYQYQLHGDQQTQLDLAQRHGLCATHSALFESVAAPREVCTGFAGVAQRQASVLRAIAQGDPPGGLACQAVAAALPNRQTCPLCGCAQEATDNTIRAAARRLGKNPESALKNLSAICLPHLGLLLRALTNPALVKAVLLREAGILDRLSEDMRHFVLKRDGVRRHLLNKEEGAAAQRTLRMLIGDQRAQIGPEPPPRHEDVTPLARRTAS